MKLMIVGVQGIGKTSLLEQLRQEGTGSYRKKPVEVSSFLLVMYHIALDLISFYEYEVTFYMGMILW